MDSSGKDDAKTGSSAAACMKSEIAGKNFDAGRGLGGEDNERWNQLDVATMDVKSVTPGRDGQGLVL